MTPPAAVAWAVHLGWIKLARPLALVGSLPAVIILSLSALTELIVDKLPNAPNRTAPLGLVARIVTGGFTGACVSLGGGQSGFVGAALGVIGGVVGCFAGYQARTRIVRYLHRPDFYVALLEDLVAIGGCVFVVSRF